MHQRGDQPDLTPEEQLAEDWRLFQAVEAGTSNYLCRTWETARPVVVVGRNGSVAEQVIESACLDDGVPVVRRFSGGGTVVLGQGCLNYTVVLPIAARPEFADVAASFRILLDDVAAALGIAGVSVSGGSDLALEGRKVSGNAQRRGRRALIHHGTLLYDFDPRVATRYLTEPARRPVYRAARSHDEFMGNIPLSAGAIRSRLETRWRAYEAVAVRPGQA